MKKIIFILFVILLSACGESFDSEPYTYTGEIYGAKYEPSHLTYSYSAQKGRMEMRQVPAEYRVYYDFLGEQMSNHSHQFYDTCTNNKFDSIQIIYVKRYSVNNKMDTTFRRNVIINLNPK